MRHWNVVSFVSPVKSTVSFQEPRFQKPAVWCAQRRVLYILKKVTWCSPECVCKVWMNSRQQDTVAATHGRREMFPNLSVLFTEDWAWHRAWRRIVRRDKFVFKVLWNINIGFSVGMSTNSTGPTEQVEWRLERGSICACEGPAPLGLTETDWRCRRLPSVLVHLSHTRFMVSGHATCSQSSVTLRGERHSRQVSHCLPSPSAVFLILVAVGNL